MICVHKKEGGKCMVSGHQATSVVHEAPQRHHGEDPVAAVLGGAEDDDELA